MDSIISVDSGSSFMKAYDGKEKVRFAAVVKECQPEDRDHRHIKVKEKYYLVGESARTATNTAIVAPHVTPGFHASHAQLVQICFAFERLGLGAEADCERDVLVVSLPYADVKNKELKKKIKAQQVFEWSAIDEDDEEHHRRVEFRNVRIVAQGIGAIQRYHATKHQRPSIVMLCDIGACTTDVIIVQKNLETQAYEYCNDACISIENFNVHWFKDQWVQNIVRDVRGIDRDKKYDYFSLMQLAIDGKFKMQLGDREVDTEKSFEETCDEFSRALKPRLQKAAGHLWHETNKIIFTGGGASLVKTDLFDKRVEKMDEWANVEGQYIMCAQLSKRQPEPKVEVPPQQQVAQHEQASASA